MTLTPRPAETLRRVMDARLAELHTAIPARVTAYDNAKQMADVQPMIKQVTTDPDGTEFSEYLPEIPSVPVAFPRGGGYFVSFPIKVGDFVLVVFAENSIDQWLEKGEDTHPVDLERHGLSGAVAYAGLYPTTHPLAESSETEMVAGKDEGSQIRIADDGSVQIGTTGGTYEKVAHATKTNDRISALESKLDNHISLYNLHTHPTAAIGPPSVTASVDTPVTPGSSVGCSLVEVE